MFKKLILVVQTVEFLTLEFDKAVDHVAIDGFGDIRRQTVFFRQFAHPDDDGLDPRPVDDFLAPGF